MLNDLIGFVSPPRSVLEMVGWVDIDDAVPGVYETTGGWCALVIATPESLTHCVLNRGKASALKLCLSFYPYPVGRFADDMARIYPTLATFYAQVKAMYTESHLSPVVLYLAAFYESQAEARAALSRFQEFGAVPVPLETLEAVITTIAPPAVVGIGRSVPAVSETDDAWPDLVARALAFLGGQ